MRNWSIPAGRIFGVELRIHLTFFFLLIFVWLTESTTHGAANPGRGLALVGIILGSVVLHALGQALVGMRAGVPAKAIILLPIGEVTLLDETQRPLEPGILTWKRDIRIAMAGPLVNIIIAAVTAGVLLAFAPQIHLLVEAVHLFRKPAAQLGLVEPGVGSVQPAAGLSNGWRPGAASHIQPHHGSSASHAARGFDWPGIRDFVHAGGHAVEYLAHHDWFLFVHCGATGRAIGCLSISA